VAGKSYADEWREFYNERKPDFYGSLAGGYRSFQDANSSRTTFAGCDISVTVEVSPVGDLWNSTGVIYDSSGLKIPSKIVTLAELHTISISTFRPTTPVNSFSGVNAKGFVQGHRTLSGSMIFAVFNRHALHQLVPTRGPDGKLQGDMVFTHPSYSTESYHDILIDQLPPFDVTIVFVNEAGNIAREALYGVKIESSGTVMSISDLLLENSVTYRALYHDPMKPIVEYAKVLGTTGLYDLLDQATYAINFEQQQMYLGQINEMYSKEFKAMSEYSATTLRNIMSNTLKKPIALEVLRQSRNPFR